MTEQLLPDVFSELLELSLKDLEKAENSPGYIVDMAVWHSPAERESSYRDDPANHGRCVVCLAGAVMAGTLEADPECFHNGGEWDGETDSRLEALDEFRVGDLESAWSRFEDTLETVPQTAFSKIQTIDHLHCTDWRLYELDVDGFKAWARAVIADLKEAGL